jgi:uroporphyrinogen-III decarboxylase
MLSEMKTRDGVKPIIVGSVSSTTTMPFGSTEDVRNEVRRCKKLAHERGGGWLLNFSSSLGPEVPKENIYAFYHESSMAHCSPSD